MAEKQRGKGAYWCIEAKPVFVGKWKCVAALASVLPGATLMMVLLLMFPNTMIGTCSSLSLLDATVTTVTTASIGWSRRKMLLSSIGNTLLVTNSDSNGSSTGSSVLPPPPTNVADTETNRNSQGRATFRTSAFGREEYTNSITASRDTNLSPREAYDVIMEQIPAAIHQQRTTNSIRYRALDLGAGAGLSTQLLYEKGYTDISAVDWSGDAWRENVILLPQGGDGDDTAANANADAANTRSDRIPESVRFFEMSDESFFQLLQEQSKSTSHQQQNLAASSDQHIDNSNSKFDVVVYNFAVNYDKAVKVAQQYLASDGVLLAPVNDRADYWYKQTYVLLGNKGNLLWKSGQEVGAWSVQFQPDVTSPTCTGIWCGGFNGFQQKQQPQSFR